MLKKTGKALSYYFCIILCTSILVYAVYGSRIHKIIICDEQTTGSITSKTECPSPFPGIVPHTYTINVVMPSGYTQTLKLKRSLHEYRVGQYVDVYYDDDRLIHWYIDAEDWRYY